MGFQQYSLFLLVSVLFDFGDSYCSGYSCSSGGNWWIWLVVAIVALLKISLITWRIYVCTRGLPSRRNTHFIPVTTAVQQQAHQINRIPVRVRPAEYAGNLQPGYSNGPHPINLQPGYSNGPHPINLQSGYSNPTYPIQPSESQPPPPYAAVSSQAGPSGVDSTVNNDKDLLVA